MPSFVMIQYGDSELRILPPVVKVPQGGTLEFHLHPDKKMSDPVDYEQSLVAIDAKDKTVAPWLQAAGTYSQGNVLSVTVPAGQATGYYQYAVDVQDLGTLDPRVEVEPN
jgi:hypothetical protein